MFHYFLSFISGALVKAVDTIEDEQKGKGTLKYPLAIAYGILIGYLIANASFANLFLGALIAQIFAGKIDKTAHMFGFALAIIALLFFGFPSLELQHVAFFLVLAFLDELTLPQKYTWITEWRLFLKIGAAAFVLFGRFDYFIAILLFDIGYMLPAIISNSTKRL